MISTSILALCGSLRRDSLNSKLLRNAIELAPSGVSISTFDHLASVPHFNADLDGPDVPEPVSQLRTAIEAADGLLIVTPEYNYNIPSAIKNALDWASRPPGEHAMRNKPVAIMGASAGPFGTVRCQLALRQTLLYLQSKVVTYPEVHIRDGYEAFDSDGILSDPKTKEIIASLMTELNALVHFERAASDLVPAERPG